MIFVPVCGGHLTAGLSVRQIFSHAKHGDANYNNKEDCDWIIEAPQGKNVLLNFLSFEMEDEQDCGYDYIQVFDGFDDSGNSYGKFCGNKVLLWHGQYNQITIYRGLKNVVPQKYSLVCFS